MKTELKAKFIQQILSKKKDNEGFTLIELLVVIIIIGILSAIALPSFLSQAAKAKQTEAKTTVSAFNRAQQTYRIENNAFASSVTSLSIGLSATSTTNYDYPITGGGTASSVVLQASAKDFNNLKGYSGGVFIIATTGDSPSFICQTTGVQGAAGAIGTVPALPTTAGCTGTVETLK